MTSVAANAMSRYPLNPGNLVAWALAEKLETVVSRGVNSTRPRDYYDIHVLWRLRGSDCDVATLRDALVATCEKRGSAGSNTCGLLLAEQPE